MAPRSTQAATPVSNGAAPMSLPAQDATACEPEAEPRSADDAVNSTGSDFNQDASAHTHEAADAGGAAHSSTDRAAGAATPSVRKPLSARKLHRFRDKVAQSGIVYMSRVPPHLKPLRLRQMLEAHARIGRIYMAPSELASRTSHGGAVDAGAADALPGAKKRKKGRSGAGAKAAKEFSEAWIEFEDKKLAKAVAELLNGAPMGGRKRSRYREDLWTLKYLPKFKWDHLTQEIGAPPALVRGQVQCGFWMRFCAVAGESIIGMALAVLPALQRSGWPRGARAPTRTAEVAATCTIN